MIGLESQVAECSTVLEIYEVMKDLIFKVHMNQCDKILGEEKKHSFSNVFDEILKCAISFVMSLKFLKPYQFYDNEKRQILTFE